MKEYSNVPFPIEPQPWRTPGKWVVFYDQIDNGIQGEGNEGNRYEAEMIVVNDLSDETITAAKELNETDPAAMQRIIDGVE